MVQIAISNCIVYFILFSRQCLILLVRLPRFTVYIVQHRMFMYRCTEFYEKKEKMKTEPLLPSSPTVKGGKRVVPKESKEKKVSFTWDTRFRLVRTYVCLSVRPCVCQCMHCSSIGKAIRTRTRWSTWTCASRGCSLSSAYWRSQHSAWR